MRCDNVSNAPPPGRPGGRPLPVLPPFATGNAVCTRKRRRPGDRQDGSNRSAARATAFFALPRILLDAPQRMPCLVANGREPPRQPLTRASRHSIIPTALRTDRRPRTSAKPTTGIELLRRNNERLGLNAANIGKLRNDDCKPRISDRDFLCGKLEGDATAVCWR
jgi:hypothetical protein